MSYFNCRNGSPHEDCNGYIGPLDTYVCPCECHRRCPACRAERAGHACCRREKATP